MEPPNDEHASRGISPRYRREAPRSPLMVRALATFAFVAVVLVLGMALGGSSPSLQAGTGTIHLGGAGASAGHAPAVEIRAGGIQPAAGPIALTKIDVNRSQSSGTYVNEYVSLNNSSTLTKIPAALTVVSASCLWVTVLNLSTTVTSVTSVQYAQVTQGNNTGIVLSPLGKTSFKICGGYVSFVDYTLWTYSLYTFTAPTLGNTHTSGNGLTGLGNLTLRYTWPTGYAGAIQTWVNTSYAFDVNHAVTLKIPTNASFSVLLPAQISQATTCDVTGQICNYQQFNLVSSVQSGTTNVTAKAILTFAQPLKNGYVNWTSSYQAQNISSNSALGGAWVSFANWVYAWWLALLILFVVIVVVAVYWDRDGRHGHRRER
jgi:hypothetical protein